MLPVKRRKIEEARPKSLADEKKKRHVVKAVTVPAPDSPHPESEPETVHPQQEDPEVVAEDGGEPETLKTFKDLVREIYMYIWMVVNRIFRASSILSATLAQLWDIKHPRQSKHNRYHSHWKVEI